MPCATCGRLGHWPHPELGCPCGTVLRIPVTGTPWTRGRAGPWGSPGGREAPDTQGPAGAPGPAGEQAPARAPGRAGGQGPASAPSPTGGHGPADPSEPADGQRPAHAPSPAGGQEPANTPGPADGQGPASAPSPAGGHGPAHVPGPDTSQAPPGAPGPAGARRSPGCRPPFRPRTIRTALDAVTTAALYLRWLGYRDIRRADQRPPYGIGLAARGLLAQVDPTVRPAGPKDVECLWLTAMTESAECVHFSLAGHTDAARAAADALGIPLFVLDLAGVPQPMNDPADALHTTGAP
ncbi:hypothetical protein [Streptomyces sp. MC1]|uniref:hypothetical protein n=1 Tax=Streptomyces sp. MC1 TaxID=295105 RepID=UPI0035A9416F